jgi:hypothetical protein
MCCLIRFAVDIIQKIANKEQMSIENNDDEMSESLNPIPSNFPNILSDAVFLTKQQCKLKKNKSLLQCKLQIHGNSAQ